MEFKARFSKMFYIMLVFLVLGSAMCSFALFSVLSGRVVLEGIQHNESAMLILKLLLFMVTLSWVLSCVSAVSQAIKGYAFVIAEEGITSTVTMLRAFAFIFVVPVKNIPYSAIKEIEEKNGYLVAVLDKDEIDVSPFLKPFVSKQYSFFLSYTADKPDEIKKRLSKYVSL